MPELPEVETVRRSLERHLSGAGIADVQLRSPGLRWPFQKDFVRRLAGGSIARFDRRGKYLLLHLDRGETLIVHLGMTGTFTMLDEAEDEPDRHDHVLFSLADGRALVYNDPRRFGSMEVVRTDELASHRVIGRLGPEPIAGDFDASVLAAALRGRRCSIKSALLNQHIVAGVGNIYACEALHRARISPRVQAESLVRRTGRPTPRCERLAPAISAILMRAIEAGGSTLQDFASPDGEPGAYPSSFRVYGRDGLRCRRRGCDGIVRVFTQQGRSTFACPRCQRS